MPTPQPVPECPPHKSTRIEKRGKMVAIVCNRCGATVSQYLDPDAK